MNKDDLPPRTTPYYGQYQRDIFLRGATTGELPNFSTDHLEVERVAKKTVSKGGWLYSNSNAGSSWTHQANREAFYRWKLIPRMLVDTNQRDMSCELKIGNSTWKFDAPIGFAPVGINKIYHPLGEINSTHVARDLNLPYCLSTAGSQSIETVARENGDGTRWFQLYWTPEDRLTKDILQQAVENGFDLCMLTLDTWQLGWRHGDIASANYAFYRGIGYELGKASKVFQEMCRERGIDLESPEAGQFWIDQVWHGKAKSWDELPSVIKMWKDLSGGKPFVLKGIQSVQDAQRAASTPGVDGIIVSNHAGRQVDGAIASLDALDNIIKAGVGEKITVMFDSGIREAADVAKALALGAKFVFVGRLWVYAMSIGGEPAVRHVMKSFLANFDILMNVGGYQSLKDFNRDAIVYDPHAHLPSSKL